jgi:hypothetical protein
MSIELEPSRSYPGRTDLLHKHSELSNIQTRLALTPEDVEELRKALAPKEEAVKIIALTLAELGNHKTPTITEWGQAKVLADKFERRGHIKPEQKPAPAAEEPSYMLFARANVRDGMNSGPTTVNELLKRIDRLEGK